MRFLVSDKCKLSLQKAQLASCLDSVVLFFAVAPPCLSLRASVGVLMSD